MTYNHCTCCCLQYKGLQWRLIFNVFFIKKLGLSRYFNPDLHQFRIQSALFTSRNWVFSALPRCYVLKYTYWFLGKIRQLSDTTQAFSRSLTNVHIKIIMAAAAHNIWHIVERIIAGIAHHVELNAQVTRPRHGRSLIFWLRIRSDSKKFCFASAPPPQVIEIFNSDSAKLQILR